ncbi:MAG: hypothetical protein AUK47_05415 [Deltaproteobacteria bacterium CG2_30_63_29]|nr:MAG: hypothetical protein AUK47_05415 [Deltaproteobacteria bacterium CG2_30_63_29]PJB33603.1 MAG: hypothetical protein CO108_30475 [Deltaproteobacteria bacterium CG_4_9_14_3_um_filter_63_12]
MPRFGPDLVEADDEANSLLRQRFEALVAGSATDPVTFRDLAGVRRQGGGLQGRQAQAQQKPTSQQCFVGFEHDVSRHDLER